MLRFPKGFPVFGDAVCSSNPIHGQGMSVAALDAIALRECLSQGDADLRQRYFDATAAHIELLPKRVPHSPKSCSETMSLVDPPADYSPLLR